MQPPFNDNLRVIADNMGIALYQRLTINEASLFLRCSTSDIKNLVQQAKLNHIKVTEIQIDFFGYQLLQYLLASVEGEGLSPLVQSSPERILRAKKVQEMTGLSRTTLWRLERKGNFPARVALSSCSVGWKLSEVEAWLQSL